MNYRHIYHAGNICDVVKHSALTLLIAHMRKKDAAFTILDTHAGTGAYDLNDERAEKTNEAKSGILKLLEAAPIEGLEEYYAIIRDLNPNGERRYYPGSPTIARKMIRQQDVLMACELHPEDSRELKRRFFMDKQVQIHHRNGYEALTALLPFATKRGLVMIDPPYEDEKEFSNLTKTIGAAHKRAPTSQFMIWYPIKERPALWRWHEEMAATGMPKQLCAEFMYLPETQSDRLNGCGLILINPPWKFEEELSDLFSALHAALETEHKGSVIKWLTNAGT
ncbi:MAG: 23S rRNA (adenine(2030)-N(6))-methyltransferase RlmJ [Alphaproteobacteria bacterium]|nr:23S rRNA (adenine(2030)-N(6))-methyltransferase RlmJ [Alphaproteobacteria bacterium]